MVNILDLRPSRKRENMRYLCYADAVLMGATRSVCQESISEKKNLDGLGIDNGPARRVNRPSHHQIGSVNVIIFDSSIMQRMIQITKRRFSFR